MCRQACWRDRRPGTSTRQQRTRSTSANLLAGRRCRPDPRQPVTHRPAADRPVARRRKGVVRVGPADLNRDLPLAHGRASVRIRTVEPARGTRGTPTSRGIDSHELGGPPLRDAGSEPDARVAPRLVGGTGCLEKSSNLPSTRPPARRPSVHQVDGRMPVQEKPQ